MADELLTQEGLHWCATLLGKGLPLSLEAQRTLLAAARREARLREAVPVLMRFTNHLPPCEGGQCVCGLWAAEHQGRAALAYDGKEDSSNG